MTKDVTFGVRVEQLDGYAYCRIFVNGAGAGALTVHKEDLPTLLIRLGLEQAGEIFVDTSEDVRRRIKNIFDGCDPDVPFELYDFGGWTPLFGLKKTIGG